MQIDAPAIVAAVGGVAVMAAMVSADAPPPAGRIALDDWTGRYAATFEGYPRWSPDGADIVFSSDAPGTLDLFIADVASGAVARVPTAGGGGHPNWAGPDALVFDSGRDGDRDIYRVDLSTGEVAQLIDVAGWDGAPAASADGRRVTYYSERDGDADLRVLNLDTGVDVALTDTPHDEHLGSWSPDGTRMVLQTTANGNRDVAVRDEASGAVRILDDHPARDHFVAWAGDAAVVFSSDRDGVERIYRLTLDGGAAEPIDVGVAADGYLMPSVSPDGSKLAFVAKQGRRETVYVFDFATGEARPLAAR